MSTLWNDLRYALRQLRKSPGFTITAIVTLALAIGANVVVFSVLNALVLRPLNVAQPKNLYSITRVTAGWRMQSYPNYLDFQARNTAFTDIAASRIIMLGVNKGTVVTRGFGFSVSGNYFDLLGVQPQLGRFFHASDEHGPNSVPYVILSDDFWRSQFNSDPRIVGQTVELNKHPFTVLGISHQDFHGTESSLWPQFWVPMVDTPELDAYNFLNDRSASMIFLLGRLKPGVTVQQATANLNAVASQLRQQYPKVDDGIRARLEAPGLLGDTFSHSLRAFLSGIMVLAFLVFAAGCTNLASVFAARATDRSRELAIRLAIGSSRANILRQLLTESILLSLLGGAVGAFVARVLLEALGHWQPIVQYPIHILATPDFRVYAVAFLLSLGSGVLFGLLPLRQIVRMDTTQIIKSGFMEMPHFRRFSLRDVLLAFQIVLCTLLVTASLVAVRGMSRAQHVRLGIHPQGVMLAGFDLHMVGYSDRQSLPVQKRMVDQATQMPGVTSAGVISYLPFSFNSTTNPVYRSGTVDLRPSNSILNAKFFSISPDYIRAAGTHLRAGRDFTWSYDLKSPRVAIVNETFARKLFGSETALGQYFLVWGTTPYQIVGIVEDGKYDSLTETQQAAMFFPLAQSPSSFATLVVRSQLAPAEVAVALHHALTTIEPDLPVTVQSWPEALALVLFPARAATAALGVMGLLAAMLAVTGIFGIAMYSVSRRMRELGLRVALGANPMQLMRSALGKPLLLLLAGSLVGLGLGVLASRLLAQIVYGATSRDPLVLGGVLLTMLCLGVLATWIPATRALRVDPTRLLREE